MASPAELSLTAATHLTLLPPSLPTETSANTLAATLVLLALYPASQARIHAEATAVFGASDDQPTSHADLQSLPFTYAVLQEGLRLAGPVGFVAKTCIKETTLPARTAAGEKIVVRVPEGALVRENVSAVHYCESEVG